MNHQTQRNELEKRLISYRNFMPYCGIDDLLKLSNEIIKIIGRLDKLKELNRLEINKPVLFYFDTKQSKSNFKTI